MVVVREVVTVSVEYFVSVLVIVVVFVIILVTVMGLNFFEHRKPINPKTGTAASNVARIRLRAILIFTSPLKYLLLAFLKFF